MQLFTDLLVYTFYKYVANALYFSHYFRYWESSSEQNRYSLCPHGADIQIGETVINKYRKKYIYNLWDGGKYYGKEESRNRLNIVKFLLSVPEN